MSYLKKVFRKIEDRREDILMTILLVFMSYEVMYEALMQLTK